MTESAEREYGRRRIELSLVLEFAEEQIWEQTAK
jgi:hypothetical protein